MTDEPVTQGRTEALEDLLAQGEQIPGVSEALAAYEELQRSAWNVAEAPAETWYSTGGNH